MAHAERGRGLKTSSEDRKVILDLVAEAIASGCRRLSACAALNVEERTIQRWRAKSADSRRGPNAAPANKLSNEERDAIIRTSITHEFVSLSPHQIVPKLADRGIFLASESTFYRVLKSEKMSVHRGHSKPRIVARPRSYEAVMPNQIYSWDITYLQSSVRGEFYYLYLFLDVFSRKIVGWEIHTRQEADLSAILLEEICKNQKIEKNMLTVHSDNGGPMKGATMLATMQRLGVVPSFSRPSVSNDNPYSEAMFKTLKYCPMFPSKAFEDIDEARVWMETFTQWYNADHLHSGINFVTPNSKHAGLDIEILRNRNDVYQLAKQKNPNRWAGKTRNWDAIAVVKLNPLKEKMNQNTKAKHQLAS